MLGNWYGDDSDQIMMRMKGLQIFLQKVTRHRLLCESEDLKGFLTEPDHSFEERKRLS
jgi:hypothetical protein